MVGCMRAEVRFTCTRFGCSRRLRFDMTRDGLAWPLTRPRLDLTTSCLSLCLHSLPCLSHYPYTMILGQISWADCLVFLIFLAPQLLIHIGLIETAICGIKALPFLRQYPEHSLSDSSRELTTNDSNTTSVRSDQRTSLYTARPAHALCSAGLHIPRHCHPLCTICLRRDARQNWQSLLLQGRSIAFCSIPHGPARLSKEANVLERNQPRRSHRNLRDR